MRTIGLFFVLLILSSPLPAEPKQSSEDKALLVITDAAGKEQKVTAWTFTNGIRRLAWLAPPDKAKEKTAGPEALVIRDELKFNFAAGVVVLVPLEQIRSIRYEEEKVTVRVAVSPNDEDDIVLVGTTAYKGINKLTLEADVDKGEAGIASLTFQGGIPKGIKGVRFPEPKVTPFKPGRPAVVTTLDKDVQTIHKVHDLQPLYQLAGGGEKLSTTLMFKKTLKLDVSKIKKISVNEGDEDSVWRVIQKEGEDDTLSLLTATTLDGQKATLVGLVGRVPFGYKLIPIKRVQSIEFDTTETPKKKVEF